MSIQQQQRINNKKARRQARKAGQTVEPQNYNSVGSLVIRKFKPLTANQERIFDSYYAGKNILMSGVAGCGKTYLAMGLGLQDVVSIDPLYEKLVIIRSVVPTRDMGFLPGSQKEKSKVYEDPYVAICSELFERGDAYSKLQAVGKLDFMTTSFIRGLTISDAVVIIDEIQNMNPHELNSVFTRMGHNTRIILCGDVRQDDLVYTREKSGMADFMKILQNMPSFDTVDFGTEDIVRGPLVKEYLITREKLERDRVIMPLVA